jgi:hypothetical protein
LGGRWLARTGIAPVSIEANEGPPEPGRRRRLAILQASFRNVQRVANFPDVTAAALCADPDGPSRGSIDLSALPIRRSIEVDP